MFEIILNHLNSHFRFNGVDLATRYWLGPMHQRLAPSLLVSPHTVAEARLSAAIVPFLPSRARTRARRARCCQAAIVLTARSGCRARDGSSSPLTTGIQRPFAALSSRQYKRRRRRRCLPFSSPALFLRARARVSTLPHPPFPPAQAHHRRHRERSCHRLIPRLAGERHHGCVFSQALCALTSSFTLSNCRTSPRTPTPTAGLPPLKNATSSTPRQPG
jgi:hypothetical protein